MTTPTATQKDRQLIENLQGLSISPLAHGIEFFAPAVIRGVHEDDIAFLIPYREATDHVVDRLMQWAAQELSETPLPRGIPILQRTGARPYSQWLESNRPDLYRRARRIVEEGLRPWQEQAFQDYNDQRDAAQKVLDGLLRQR